MGLQHRRDLVRLIDVEVRNETFEADVQAVPERDGVVEVFPASLIAGCNRPPREHVGGLLICSVEPAQTPDVADLDLHLARLDAPQLHPGRKAGLLHVTRSSAQHCEAHVAAGPIPFV
jgi:hypothetical protein